jgi:hypothetical protein
MGILFICFAGGGGGVPSISSLLVLRQFLYLMQLDQNMEHLPKPCDLFDMISGTGTGGLVLQPKDFDMLISDVSVMALMLGRLGMSIDDAITAFRTAVGQVFGSTPTMRTSRLLWWLRGGPSIHSRSMLLEEVIKKIIAECGSDPNLRMLEEGTIIGCPVFVVAARMSGEPALFRSYKSNLSGIDEYAVHDSHSAESWTDD